MKNSLIILCVTVAVVMSGCSMKKNTGMTRFYHSFTTRYNVFYNAHTAYDEGLDAIYKGNTDFYGSLIPLDPLGNQKTVGAGKSNFDRAIEKSEKSIKLHSIRTKPKRKPAQSQTAKDKQWYAQKEFNPFLYHAWLTIGKAQYMKGEYLEAAATFSYITRLYDADPQVLAEARVFMARCYAQLDWFYDSENTLNQARLDGVPKKQEHEYNFSMANYLLRGERYDEALPYLQQIVNSEKKKPQRMRELFLLGQILQMQGKAAEADKAYSKLLNMSPPYEMELNTRIRQTEVMPQSKSKTVIKKMQRWAKQDKNKDYLDQIYYAIGNAYMTAKDTANAMANYRLAIEKSTKGGMPKAIAQLTLGQICWEKMKYAEAEECYKGALSVIDKTRSDYAQIEARTKVLSALVAQQNVIDLEDSLQLLARMPEAERMEVINTIIADLIKKEKEQQEAENEANLLAAHQADQANNAPIVGGNTAPVMPNRDNSWYFYNEQVVAQGKATFQNQWGNRTLEDNWRRRNKARTINSATQPVSSLESDSIIAVADTITQTLSDSTALADSLAGDPHNPEYYLKQIPLTDEAMEQSNGRLSDALFNIGFIYKDQLEDPNLTLTAWGRLMNDFPEYKSLDEVYYNLYLMYLRYGDSRAEEMRELLIQNAPDSKLTAQILAPNFLDNLYYGEKREDSIYALTYDAFRANEWRTVIVNDTTTNTLYPNGKNRARFTFLHAIAALRTGDQPTFLDRLKILVQEYPKDSISLLANDILQGINDGRLINANADFGSIWQRRANLTANGDAPADSASIAFNAEHTTPFVLLLAFPAGEIYEDRLLYEMARFNFSTFVVKNFDLSYNDFGSTVRILETKSFATYEECLHYFRLLYKDSYMATILSGLRPVLISERNYELLLKYYSFEDYEQYFQEHFGELPSINSELIIDEEESTLDEPLQNLPEEQEDYEDEQRDTRNATEDIFLD